MLNPKNIIVVGGNAAGPAAAAKAKRIAPGSNVVIFEANDYISTGTCELPYVLSGEIKNYEDIVFYDPQKFENEKGVKVFINHLVEGINRREKTISIRDLKLQIVIEHKYDKLILATGSRPKRIPVLHSGLKNVFTLKSVQDLISIQKYRISEPVKNVLIIGAGYIGLETADAFLQTGCSVTIYEKNKLPMPGVDFEIQMLVLDLLEKNNIEFINELSDPRFIIKNEKVVSVNFNGRILEFDIIVTAIGFEPNNNLTVAAKLQTGKSGGLRVNNKLQTSDPNIYAAGDSIEIQNRITNQYEYLPLATLAQQFGHIAGENAAGGNVFIRPVVKNIGVKLFGNYLSIVGLNSSDAEINKFNYQSVSAVVPNLVKVMPASRNVYGKIIYDKNSKLILGAFFLGGPEVAGFSDLISLMINNKICVLELRNNNYNYTPPLSPFVNLLSVLGRKIKTEK